MDWEINEKVAFLHFTSLISLNQAFLGFRDIFAQNCKRKKTLKPGLKQDVNLLLLQENQ